MREIAFDTETTGLDPASGHRVIEIGCVEMTGHVRTGQHFHFYLNPERDVPEEAARIHGIRTDFLLDKPKFPEIAGNFIAFLGDAPLVIHNAAFDMKFINFELERAGFDSLPMTRAIDTVQIARRKFPGAPASLDALCKRFGIDLSARSHHGALLDAELLADVYLELMGGRQSALGLNSAAAPRALAGAGLPESAAIVQGLKILEASAEECEAHRTFLKTLKNPIWEKAEA